MTTATGLSGLRKAAILMVSLGRERTSRLLGVLSPEEVERLTAEIALLQEVPRELAEDVHADFLALMQTPAAGAVGGLTFAKQVLQAAFGEHKAAEIFSGLAASLTRMPFEFLRDVEHRQILSFVQNEHPQCIALILAHLGATGAAAILSGLPGPVQADVAVRIATMDRTSPDVVGQVESVLERKASSVAQPSETLQVGGLGSLVEIVNHADRGTERIILEGLEERDKELCERVRAEMFVFEDIITLDDRSVQLVLRAVEIADLALALKGVRADVRDKVLRNMSERAAITLREEVEILGPARVKAVEEAQAKVVQTIRALEEAGQVTISRGRDDEFVS